MIEASASEVHYLDHIAPIARALGCKVWCDSNDLATHAAMQGLDGVPGIPLRPSDTPLLVASWRDAHRAAATRPLILLEHGAGQTYQGIQPPSPNYAGGPGWDQALLILTPGPHASTHWRNTYPQTPVVELRGSPRLDPYTRHHPQALEPSRRKNAPVGVSFHWDCPVVPETADTAQEWRLAVAELARSRPVLCHAHPKAWGWLRHEYTALGLEATPSFSELLDRCWVYVCDNSSTMFEWAALGRPVVALNGSQYRRSVHHGLRFWDAVPGVEVDRAEELAPAVAMVTVNPWGVAWAQALGRRAAEAAYGGLWDGKSLDRALAAIRALGV